jgi:hypothetical protein
MILRSELCLLSGRKTRDGKRASIFENRPTQFVREILSRLPLKRQSCFTRRLWDVCVLFLAVSWTVLMASVASSSAGQGPCGLSSTAQGSPLGSPHRLLFACFREWEGGGIYGTRVGVVVCGGGLQMSIWLECGATHHPRIE